MKRLTKTATGRLKVRLGGRHRDQLLRAAKTHSKPQIRERAAAILKVAPLRGIQSDRWAISRTGCRKRLTGSTTPQYRL